MVLGLVQLVTVAGTSLGAAMYQNAPEVVARAICIEFSGPAGINPIHSSSRSVAHRSR